MTYGNPFVAAADRYAAGRPYHHARTLGRALAGRRPRSALDVACGTGLSTRGLADLGIPAVGTDLVPAMVARARADTGLPYAVASAEALPVASGSVELVTVSSAVHWFGRDRFLAEVARVLRPGGLLLLYEHAGARPADPAYVGWVGDTYLVRYPAPPRGPMAAAVEPGERFVVERSERWRDEVPFTLAGLVAYLLSQTNLVDEDPAVVTPWLRAELRPFFPGQEPVPFAFDAGAQLLRLVG
ncbi:MAG TPA: class I SAM-dependent methyltransferase [Mycobacteriales bacterium]|nr:class I SAM-dependent methyltransferase [Mycobacteriales bacterium]